jgi:hypothetical protein
MPSTMSSIAILAALYLIYRLHVRLVRLETKPPRVILVEGDVELYDDEEKLEFTI